MIYIKNAIVFKLLYIHISSHRTLYEDVAEGYSAQLRRESPYAMKCKIYYTYSFRTGFLPVSLNLQKIFIKIERKEYTFHS